MKPATGHQLWRSLLRKGDILVGVSQPPFREVGTNSFYCLSPWWVTTTSSVLATPKSTFLHYENINSWTERKVITRVDTIENGKWTRKLEEWTLTKGGARCPPSSVQPFTLQYSTVQPVLLRGGHLGGTSQSTVLVLRVSHRLLHLCCNSLTKCCISQITDIPLVVFDKGGDRQPCGCSASLIDLSSEGCIGGSTTNWLGSDPSWNCYFLYSVGFNDACLKHIADGWLWHSHPFIRRSNGYE